MIQHAFTGAYTSQVSAQSQGINTITSGIKDAATLVAGVLGFSGALGSGALAKGAEHALAGRVGGVGGNIMLATMQQKKERLSDSIQNSLCCIRTGDKISIGFRDSLQRVWQTDFRIANQ